MWAREPPVFFLLSGIGFDSDWMKRRFADARVGVTEIRRDVDEHREY
jgi:hypothetical protein